MHQKYPFAKFFLNGFPDENLFLWIRILAKFATTWYLWCYFIYCGLCGRPERSSLPLYWQTIIYHRPTLVSAKVFWFAYSICFFFRAQWVTLLLGVLCVVPSLSNNPKSLTNYLICTDIYIEFALGLILTLHWLLLWFSVLFWTF